MEIGKHAAPAIVAAIVGLLAGAAGQHLMPGKERIVEKPVQVTVAASKHAWPDLTQDETIAIGEKLAALKDVRINIFCNDAACDDLAHDLDDAMEIAGARSSLDHSVLPIGYGFSIMTGDGDDRGQSVADAVKNATAGRLNPGVEHSSTAEGAILIVIGKHGR